MDERAVGGRSQPHDHRFPAQRGVVVMLDALGIKGVLARSNASQVMHEWQRTIAEFEDRVNQALLDPEGYVETANVHAFSDTIIITITGSDPTELVWAIGSLIMEPFCSAIERGVFLRGVIASGEFYEHRSMVIGPAIDEAADWYERADWIGILSSPSVAMVLDTAFLQTQAILDLFIPHEVPIRDRRTELTWALSWPRHFMRRQLVQGIALGEVGPALILEALRRPPIGFAVIDKYTHTLAFFDRFVPGAGRKTLSSRVKDETLRTIDVTTQAGGS